MRIYIVRHGETEWNKNLRWQGSKDVVLNETGREQAQKVALRLKDSKIEHIYASPLSRALDTAKAINQNLNMPITLRDDLKEIILGEWEGHTYEEISKTHSQLLEKWDTEPTYEIGLGVENYSSVEKRAYAALQEICNNHENDVLIVTHGAWIRALFCKILNIPLTNRLGFEVGNTSLNILDYKKSKQQFRVITLNDIFHLDN